MFGVTSFEKNDICSKCTSINIYILICIYIYIYEKSAALLLESLLNWFLRVYVLFLSFSKLVLNDMVNVPLNVFLQMFEWQALMFLFLSVCSSMYTMI